MDDFLIN